MNRNCIALAILANSLLFLPAHAEESTDKPKSDPAKSFAKMDTNSDGAVTKQEFMALPKAQKDPEKASKKFGKMDADANGSLSLDEFEAAKKAKEAKSGGSEE